MSTATTTTRALPAASQRIAPQKFAHVVLKTANFNDVIDWYATVLQARVAFRNDFIAFLTYDDEHHRVAVINMPDSPAPEPAPAGQDAYGHARGDSALNRQPMIDVTPNRPEVMAEVSVLFERYEQALIDKNVEVLDATFWNSPYMIRYALGEHGYGFSEIHAH